MIVVSVYVPQEEAKVALLRTVHARGKGKGDACRAWFDFNRFYVVWMVLSLA